MCRSLHQRPCRCFLAMIPAALSPYFSSICFFFMVTQSDMPLVSAVFLSVIATCTLDMSSFSRIQRLKRLLAPSLSNSAPSGKSFLRVLRMKRIQADLQLELFARPCLANSRSPSWSSSSALHQDQASMRSLGNHCSQLSAKDHSSHWPLRAVAPPSLVQLLLAAKQAEADP